MIIFHEGLPRSGKSYEAVVRRIAPALKSGRQVFAYVDGLDHDKIAGLVDKPADEVRELLHVITDEDLQRLPEVLADNCLAIIDEAQNHWPNRQRLSPEMTKFVAEHGHRGIDIVLMGQDLRDVHALWRRRVEIKTAFLKLSGLGRPNSYSVTTYRHKGGEQYDKVSTQVHKYDPAWFGTYKSFVSDDTNTQAYTDDRANLLKHPLFKYAIPGALVLGIWGLYTAVGFFRGAPEPEKTAPRVEKLPAMVRPAPAPVVAPAAAPAPVAPPPEPARPEDPAERLMVDLGKYRMRLAGIIRKAGQVNGYVEWITDGDRVMHRMDFDTLREIGVSVNVKSTHAVLSVGDWLELATIWPREEPLGRVGLSTIEQLKGDQAAPVLSPTRGTPDLAPVASVGHVSSGGRADLDMLAWAAGREGR